MHGAYTDDEYTDDGDSGDNNRITDEDNDGEAI